MCSSNQDGVECLHFPGFTHLARPVQPLPDVSVAHILHVYLCCCSLATDPSGLLFGPSPPTISSLFSVSKMLLLQLVGWVSPVSVMDKLPGSGSYLLIKSYSGPGRAEWTGLSASKTGRHGVRFLHPTTLQASN